MSGREGSGNFRMWHQKNQPWQDSKGSKDDGRGKGEGMAKS